MQMTLFQMDIIPGDPAANREVIKRWFAQELASVTTDVVVLPEMWTTAYTLPELHQLAESEDDTTLELMKQLAKQYDVHLVAGSIAINTSAGIVNRALIINRSGELVYSYDKLHLVPMLNEPDYLIGGSSPVQSFTLDGITCGIIICYDLRFPEIVRELALQGVEVLFIPAEWPDARASHWEILQQARAIENQMYVVSVNRIGSYDGIKFAGRSMVVDPWGNMITTGTADQEEVLHADINLENVKAVRKNVPVFSSRVPHLYRNKPIK
ncbi:carbon-nitrogen family hydrolase [Salsuginibacillus kocurii]|uniref:carbon-nitrogen family hydrolase n=1 Tax=Salsuginibacillus kocurii TaxID=427078 RepID=UPI0003722973|nr:carbon-nitrogen family hydrolase [Salsuginibacillus kocurii]